jgi:hypothetical protein
VSDGERTEDAARASTSRRSHADGRTDARVVARAGAASRDGRREVTRGRARAAILGTSGVP